MGRPSRFDKVANAIGRDDIPTTSNIVERTIKAFSRHYKHMAGFESLQTARIQVSLFRFFYRLTPMWEAKLPEHRGLSPLERAGWCTRGVPVADFVRRFTTAWDEDGPDVFAAPAAHTTPAARPRPSPGQPEARGLGGGGPSGRWSWSAATGPGGTRRRTGSDEDGEAGAR